MSVLEQVLRRIRSDLEAAKFEFAVVGALAVSIHTAPRFTRDADLAVSVKLAGASRDDLELARESLGLISARGYHRNRDLAVDFERLLKDFSG